jgi:hypothetical protein
MMPNLFLRIVASSWLDQVMGILVWPRLTVTTYRSAALAGEFARPLEIHRWQGVGAIKAGALYLGRSYLFRFVSASAMGSVPWQLLAPSGPSCPFGATPEVGRQTDIQSRPGFLIAVPSSCPADRCARTLCARNVGNAANCAQLLGTKIVSG